MFTVTILATCHRAGRSRLETVQVHRKTLDEALEKAAIHCRQYVFDLGLPDSGSKVELSITLAETTDSSHCVAGFDAKCEIVNVLDEVVKELKSR